MVCENHKFSALPKSFITDLSGHLCAKTYFIIRKGEKFMSLANRKTKLLVAMLSLLLVIPMTNAFAMHIMEGYLPPNYCIIWGVVCIPFLIAGGISMQKQAKKNNKTKILLHLQELSFSFFHRLKSLQLQEVVHIRQVQDSVQFFSDRRLCLYSV